MQKVTNLCLNGSTAKAIAKRVMKDKNIQVVRKFSPVTSEYTLPVGNDRRMNFKISDDIFQFSEDRKINGIWKEYGSYELRGSNDEVENKFIQLLSDATSILK